MRLKLQNIGIIESADINVDGITLIAGQNDSGKSTVGKVLYAIVKGFNQEERVFEEEKNSAITYNYQKILKELKKYDDIIFSEYQTQEIDQKWINKINKIIDSESVKESKVIISRALLMLNFYQQRKYDSIEQKAEEIDRWLEPEISVLHNKFSSIENASEIKIEDLNGVAIITQKYDKNSGIYSLELDNNLETYFKDAYFIESPLVIDDSLRRYIGKEYHTRNRQDELASLLSNTLSINSFDYSGIYKEITEIINGEIAVDLLDGVRYKKNNLDISIKNTAVGIKSFGLIQLLLKNNRLNDRTLLIIDEPELYLHPTWQVKYAEILVRLAKEFAIPIVLTSHSPYFIEALEAYTKKYKYEKSTNFYFAGKNEDGLSSKIVNVTENITPILKSISEAFFEIQDINDED
jgi:predicted ATPase